MCVPFSRLFQILVTGVIGCLLGACEAHGRAQVATPVVSGNARVDHLIAQMTLAEKISLVHGVLEPPANNQGQAGYWPGVARLGIPALRLADGPPGVLTRQPSTGMTATMGLAATFSPEDAYANGVVIGRDARALGQQVVLQPFINLYRDPTFVRAYNTFGEDPLLSGAIAAAQVRGTQSQHVMALAKHFIAYDGANDVQVSGQPLEEIYAAPFAAVINAGVASIMCSYNRINGPYACGNPQTLEHLLRVQLGFEGFVTSDWGADHDTAFIKDGLDLEMPGEQTTIPSYFSDSLRAAVRQGQVPESVIDRAVGRILRQVERFGYLDHPPSLRVSAEPVRADGEVVLKTAEDAAVLLKNAGALPLHPATLPSVALIGPGAGQTIAIGIPGEKALGHVERQIGTYYALQRLLGPAAAHLQYAVADDMTGSAIPATQLSHGGAPGLQRDKDSVADRADGSLDFTRHRGNALPPASYRWRGTFSVPETGRYFISLQLLGALGAFSVDGTEFARTDSLYLHGTVLQPGQSNVLPTTDGLDNLRREIQLTAGAHTLSVEARPDESGDPMQVRLAWLTPARQRANHDAALAAARNARYAVVFAWSQGQPIFGLPGDQDRLIEDIAAVNPNTIVVLNLSQPIALPWLQQVNAVLLMWYPGDEGGWATANLLLGQVSPAGRLPFSWPQRLGDELAIDPSVPARSSAGVQGKTVYSEGIFIGYRWFDRQSIEPLFPFGFGLSYSHFDYSALRMQQRGDGDWTARFTLHNRGTRGAEEVAQVYLGPPEPSPATAQFAVRALAGFERVHLSPGETRTVTIAIPLRSLQYWDDGQQRWTLPAGPRKVYVGASSRDIRLTGSTAEPQ